MLKLHNSLSRMAEPIGPRDPSGPITFYTCGPTVYDVAHIGNFRSFLNADLLRRTLEFFGHVVHRWPTRIKRDGPGWVPKANRFGRSAQRIVQLQHRELPEVWLAAGRGRTGVAGSPIKSIPPGSLPKAVERAASIDPLPIRQSGPTKASVAIQQS